MTDGLARESPAVLLDARGFAKTFGPTRVLAGVDVSVRSGEVRGLLGQNGSGKSTFIKLVTGVHEPDAGGELWIAGRPVPLPVSSRSAPEGLGVMHQDLGMEPSLSVLDNFLLSGSGARLRRIRWRREAERVAETIASYGLELDVRRPVEDLSRSERAVVAMARALDRLGERGGVLLLDEPTAPLERDSVAELFAAIHTVRERGCGVLYVSHDLGEVRELCDTVTVLRDGAVVAEGETAEFDDRTLIQAIVGKDIGEVYPAKAARPRSQVVLSVRGLKGHRVRDLSFDLHEGEILGITGLAGMGQDVVPGLVYGSTDREGGEIALLGRAHAASPKASMAAGMILLPADRKALGGDPDASLVENLTIATGGRYYRHGRMQRRQATADVREALDAFGVRPLDPQRPLGQLSGGNQQKALLAKWMRLFGRARVLLLHEPTQGVDIGARQDIFRLVSDAVAQGQSVLYVSSEYEDLANLCDRVIVMRHGHPVSELERGSLSADALAASALAPDPAAAR